MGVAKKDSNSVASLLGVSSVDSVTPIPIAVDPVTGRVLVDAVSTVDLIVGTSAITNGTNGKILYDNNGVVGELTNNFLTSLTGAVLTDQTVGQTIGLTGSRLTKLWVTDITCTNAITGSVTDNAGTVTGLTVASGKTLTVNGNSTIGLAAIQFENAGGFICATSKTLTVNQIITLAALADSQTFTFPATSDTVMGLSAVQSVTGKKTFDKDKIELKGTSTGVIVLSNANTSATTYTLIAPAVDDTIAAIAATQTLTNKRITPRVGGGTTYTTDTGTSIDCGSQDYFIVTAQAGALKFNNPQGTPTDGQKLIISVASSTTAARALTWDTAYGATTIALPTTTAATTVTLTMGFIYSTSKSLWQIVGVS